MGESMRGNCDRKYLRGGGGRGSGVSGVSGCSDGESGGKSKSGESCSRSGRSLAKSPRASLNSENSEEVEGEGGSESRVMTGMGGVRSRTGGEGERGGSGKGKEEGLNTRVDEVAGEGENSGRVGVGDLGGEPDDGAGPGTGVPRKVEECPGDEIGV